MVAWNLFAMNITLTLYLLKFCLVYVELDVQVVYYSIEELSSSYNI